MPRDELLGMFAKCPQAGRVKSRLAADIGNGPAARLYAAFVEDLLERFRAMGERRILGYAPNTAEAAYYFRGIAGADYELWPQPDVDLGGRIAAFFEAAFRSGAQRIVLIGSDSPTLPAEFVRTAFRTLASAECVIGPARDGGYYLVGLSRPCPELFDGIGWSGPDVLRQTLDVADRIGVAPLLLPEWYDVDTPNDLRVLRDELRELQASQSPDFPARTAAFFAGDIPTAGRFL